MFSKVHKKIIASCSVLLLLSACSSEEEAAVKSSSSSVMASSALSDASAAMGMDGLNSISWSGSAWSIRNSFRQTLTASPPWPERDAITNYTRTLDLTESASLATGDTFWQNLFFDPAVAGTYTQNIPASQSNWGQQLEIWLSPWGFLQGAELNGAEEGTDANYRTITWMSPASQISPSGLQYTVTGYINNQNLVERVETWVEDSFMGDMHVTALYSDYAEQDGVMVPATMEQERGEGSVFGVTVNSTSINPSNLASLMTPPPSTGGGGGAPTELTQKLADGVFLVTGGYGALAVEFDDYITVFESGQSEARGQQIIDEVKGAIPNKPIRFIVNSHPHSDHTAGLIPFVREGATIITHENNIEFLNMALSTPRTLLGEETLDPQFVGVSAYLTQQSADMRFEFHHIDNGHADGMLVGYLPEQGILFQADFTLPVAGADANPFVVKLAEYVDEKGLEFDTYLAVHAAAVPQSKADLMATIGK